jgi:uncharacterized protein
MFSIRPRDGEFYALFERAAAVVVTAAEAYVQIGQDYARRSEHINRIRQCEHEGDEVAHQTLAKLDRSFITPFDREDIQRLMKQLDDVIDEIDAGGKRITLYRIQEPTSWFIRQTQVLQESTRLVAQAIRQLRSLKKPQDLQQFLIEIHRLENLGDENNHAAVAELYDRATDPMLVMKWKEIYDYTERAIDRCEDIANTIEAIILKNT